jgi:hypothetical protein
MYQPRESSPYRDSYRSSQIPKKKKSILQSVLEKQAHQQDARPYAMTA